MIVGNLLSRVRAKTSESVLFCDNVLVDAEADAGKLDKSLVGKHLGLSQ